MKKKVGRLLRNVVSRDFDRNFVSCRHVNDFLPLKIAANNRLPDDELLMDDRVLVAVRTNQRNVPNSGCLSSTRIWDRVGGGSRRRREVPQGEIDALPGFCPDQPRTVN